MGAAVAVSVRTRARWFSVLVGLIAAASLVAADRAGAVGQITFGGCVSDDGSGGFCADAPSNALSQAEDVDVSPDGSSVYVAARQTDAVAVFDRAAAGQLTYAGCASANGSGGLCADLPDGVMDVPVSVAASPDGAFVYVGSLASQSIVTFHRAPTGQLTYEGCVSSDGTGGKCVNLPGTPLVSLTQMGLAPDGSVYAAADGVVSVYGWDFTGPLDYAGCVSNDGSGALCADAPGSPLSFGRSVKVSPDGKSVYVGGGLGVLSVFDRAAGGQITYAGCVSDDGSSGLCQDVPGVQLALPESIALSPDGTSVYVAGFTADTVSVYDRAAGGQLTYSGCVSSNGSGGLCQDAPGDVLQQPAGLEVSGDGFSLYAASFAGGAVSVLDRAQGGQLTYSGCVSGNGSGGLCADAPGNAIAGPEAVDVSPDDGSVYTIDFNTSSVAHFFRKEVPDTRIDSGPQEGATTADTTPRFSFSADQEGASFECAVDLDKFVPCVSGAPVRPLADGEHTFFVHAITGGDVDATAAARTFRVDTTGPRARFVRAPKRVIRTKRRKASVTFAFRSREAGARFLCKVDRRPLRPCTSPRSLRLSRGAHRFTVRAIDRLGNRGPAITRRVRVARRR